MSNIVLNQVPDVVPDALEAEAPQGHPRRWAILALILAVEVMDLIDGTIVNVASPAIRGSLGASLSALQWIAGGYALTFAIGLVTGGRLGDIFGRRRLFLVGVAGFTLMSALCGAAQSPEMLIATRLLQGLFAAIMIPQGFGILKQVFPDEELGKAFGLFGPVIGLSAVLGPVIGGLLVDGPGWRGIFLVNVPLGIAALIGARRLLGWVGPDPFKAKDRPTLDLGGAALVSLAAGLLIYPLIQGREAGWPAWTYASIAAAIATLGVFALYERRRERHGVSPLVTPSLFRKRAFSGGLVTALVFFAGMIGLMLVFTLYLQLGQGFSAIGAGLALVPWSLGTAIGAGAGAGALGPKLGRPTLHLGLIVMLGGILGMLAVVHGAGDDVSAWGLAGPELLAGIGMGAMLAPLFDFVLAGVEDHEVGSASGVLNAMQQLGGAIGIAVIGTLFFSVADHHGITTALEKMLYVEAGVLLVAMGLVFLLPMRARENDL
jgi:EmrB/QacA subfamily drug resistance transporter